MKFLAAIPLLFLIACTKAETPAPDVYIATVSYTKALKTEVAYGKRPRCGLGVVVKCSELSVIRKMRTADDLAYSALKQAQLTSKPSDIAGANVLIDAFTDTVNPYKGE